MADADAEAMIGNPAYKTVLEAFVADAENGKTSLLKAQEIETNLKKWKTEVVDPHYLKKDQDMRRLRRSWPSAPPTSRV